MAIGTTAAIGLAASGLGGISQASAARRASKAQESAAQQELALQNRIYDETSANFAPYREGGLQGYQAYLSEMGLGEAPTINGQRFGGFQETPGYQFQLARGRDEINSSGAARGNYLSGANLAGAMQFGQGLANQEYNNYLNRLQLIGQQGQAAAGNQAAAGQAYAAGAGNALAGIGNAQAAGAIGQGNAFAGATNNLMGTLGYLNSQNNNGQGFWGQNIFAGNANRAPSLFGGNSWG